MRFSNLIAVALLGMSVVTFAKAAEDNGGGAEAVVDGVKITLSAADLNNIKTIIDDSRAAQGGDDGSWPVYASNDDVLGFAHTLVLSGAFETISAALSEGAEEFANQCKKLGITNVTEYLANHPQNDDIYDFDDVEYDDDVDPDLLAMLDALFGDQDEQRANG